MNASCSWPTWCRKMLVEPELGVLGEPRGVPAEVGGDVDDLAHRLASDVLADRVERRRRGRCPSRPGVGKHVAAPLLVGDRLGLVLVGRPGQVHLQVRARPRPPASRYASIIWRSVVDGLVDRDQPVGPLRAPAAVATLTARAEERRRLGRQRPDRARSTVTSPSWLTSSPRSSARMTSTHSRRRAARTSLRGQPSPVMCSLLASPRAQRGPEAAGEHRGQRADGLRDDRRVVALAGRVDHAERQATWPAGRRRATTTRTPSGPAAALHGAKWSEHIAASNPAASACRHGSEERAGMDLLVGGSGTRSPRGLFGYPGRGDAERDARDGRISAGTRRASGGSRDRPRAGPPRPAPAAGRRRRTRRSPRA